MPGFFPSHKVPVIQMMSHMFVAHELNAKQLSSYYSPDPALPVWPWKIDLVAADWEGQEKTEPVAFVTLKPPSAE